MTALVEILQSYATTYGWYFSYGNASNRNLLSSDTTVGKIYLLLDPVRRSIANSEFGGLGEATYSGSFMLLIKSDRDQQYHNQKDQLASTGKYEKNIKPMLDLLNTFNEDIACDDLQVNTWDIIDLVDVLDVNMDGLLVTYSIVMQNGYTV